MISRSTIRTTVIAARRMCAGVFARLTRALALGLVLAALASCGKPTKETLIEKSRDISSRDALAVALGQPDKIDKLGPIEVWTYTASNGKVTFLITGDLVALQAAGGSR